MLKEKIDYNVDEIISNIQDDELDKVIKKANDEKKKRNIAKGKEIMEYLEDFTESLSRFLGLVPILKSEANVLTVKFSSRAFVKLDLETFYIEYTKCKDISEIKFCDSIEDVKELMVRIICYLVY